MKLFSSILACVSGAALTLAPLSIELSSSLFVAAGILALLVRDYGRELPMVAQTA